MILALRADAPVRFEVLLPDNRPAALALGPQPFGLHAALVGRRGLIDPFFLSLKPGHGRFGTYFKWSLWVAALQGAENLFVFSFAAPSGSVFGCASRSNFDFWSLSFVLPISSRRCRFAFEFASHLGGV